MSNNLPTTNTAVSVPAYLQEADNKFGSLDMGGGGVPRVAVRNGAIMLLVNGTITHTFGQSTDVIIVGAQPGFGRIYYDAPYNSDSEEGQLPACWSTDNVEAHPVAPGCPSATRKCAGCPKNVAGSAANGKAKACQYAKALALVFPGDPNPGTVYRLLAKGTTMFGDDNPAQNLFNLRNLSNYFQTHRIPLGGMVLTMSVDINSPVPGKLLFSVRDWVPQDFYEGVLKAIPDDHIDMIAKMDFEQAWAARQQAQNTGQAAPAQPTQAAPAQVPPVQPQPAPMAAPVTQSPPVVDNAQPAPQPVQPQPVQPQPEPQQPAQPQQSAPAQPEPQQVQAAEQPASSEDLAALLQRFQEKGAGQL